MESDNVRKYDDPLKWVNLNNYCLNKRVILSCVLKTKIELKCMAAVGSIAQGLEHWSCKIHGSIDINIRKR